MTTPDDEETALSTLDGDGDNVLSSTSSQEKTLLPAPLASLVSVLTRSSLVSVRLGSFLGGLAIDGARVGTLTGLELSRAVLENVFLSGGKDVVGRSHGQLGKDEAESILERSIATLHSTVTKASFVVSSGFHLSSAALSSASTLSSILLSALDAILGSTESSRAIASIVTLIRREFRNPETGIKGERVGVIDLLVGVTGLALLQRWCSKRIEADVRVKASEEVIWDVIVLDNGRRADVDGSTRDALVRQGIQPSSSVSSTGQAGVYGAINRHGEDTNLRSLNSPPQMEDQGMEMELRRRLLTELPPDAQVSIKTEVLTTKTITVEVLGVPEPHITPPAGTFVVEEDSTQRHSLPGDATGEEHPLSPHYKIVFQSGQPTPGESRDDSRTRPHAETQFHGRVSELSGDDSTQEAETTTLMASPPTSPDLEGIPVVSPLESRMDHAEGLQMASPSRGMSRLPMSEDTSATDSADLNLANQKRTRKPPMASQLGRLTQPTFSAMQKAEPKNVPKTKTSSDKAEKRTSLKRPWKKGASNGNLSGMFSKDEATETSSGADKTQDRRPPWGWSRGQAAMKELNASRQQAAPKRTGVADTSIQSPQTPQRGNPNFFSSRDLGEGKNISNSPSRASYYSIHERRRDSIVSQTDTFSVHSADLHGPGSPSRGKTHLRTTSNMAMAKSQNELTVKDLDSRSPKHRKSRAHASSIYTLRTNNSDTSLVLASRPVSSALDDPNAIATLCRSGMVNGQFPRAHIVDSISRFARFASASYGSSFLRLMGISSPMAPTLMDQSSTEHHYEHHSFSSHTQSSPSTILLSSFVDPQGGTNAAGETNSGVPLIHFVSLDHESKTVILTCRGTLGFEDILTDMTCDYDDMVWRGQSFKVHKGIHASARRLLGSAESRVMATIRAALEEFTDYGLVMCGHSLGGAVAALLAIMVSEPHMNMTSGSAFLTSSRWPYGPSMIGNGRDGEGSQTTWVTLPSGRPIHVFAYGPPATLSPSLRLATRGLITTVVNGQDVVPFLSLGTLHDLQGVALAFKTDTSNAKGEVRSRVWEGLKNGLLKRIDGERLDLLDEENDQWSWSALKSLRASMLSAKLVPPGEVFVIETQPVLQRDAFTTSRDPSTSAHPDLGRPARRAILKYIRDVEGRFGELNFGPSMLGDHSPGRYEANLATLARGVLDKSA